MAAEASRKGRTADLVFAWGCMVLWTGLSVWASRQKADMAISFGVTCFCLAVLYPMMPVVTRMFFPGYDQLDETKLKQGLWINTMVSVTHSYAASILSVTALALSWDQLGNMLSVPHNPWPFICVSVSTGYFAYDTWDFIQSGLWRKSKHIVVHHFAVTSLFWIGLFLDLGVLYLVVTLVCEINSVFLHTRTLMNMAKFTYKNSRMRLVWKGLWFTFYATRFASHGSLFFLMIRDYKAWFAMTWPGYWWIAMAGLVLFNALNLDLYFSVGKVYRKAKKAARGE